MAKAVARKGHAVLVSIEFRDPRTASNAVELVRHILRSRIWSAKKITVRPIKEA